MKFQLFALALIAGSEAATFAVTAADNCLSKTKCAAASLTSLENLEACITDTPVSCKIDVDAKEFIVPTGNPVTCAAGTGWTVNSAVAQFKELGVQQIQTIFTFAADDVTKKNLSGGVYNKDSCTLPAALTCAPATGNKTCDTAVMPLSPDATGTIGVFSTATATQADDTLVTKSAKFSVNGGKNPSFTVVTTGQCDTTTCQTVTTLEQLNACVAASSPSCILAVTANDLLSLSKGCDTPTPSEAVTTNIDWIIKGVKQTNAIPGTQITASLKLTDPKVTANQSLKVGVVDATTCAIPADTLTCTKGTDNSCTANLVINVGDEPTVFFLTAKDVNQASMTIEKATFIVAGIKGTTTYEMTWGEGSVGCPAGCDGQLIPEKFKTCMTDINSNCVATIKANNLLKGSHNLGCLTVPSGETAGTAVFKVTGASELAAYVGEITSTLTMTEYEDGDVAIQKGSYADGECAAVEAQDLTCAKEEQTVPDFQSCKSQVNLKTAVTDKQTPAIFVSYKNAKAPSSIMFDTVQFTIGVSNHTHTPVSHTPVQEAVTPDFSVATLAVGSLALLSVSQLF